MSGGGGGGYRGRGAFGRPPTSNGYQQYNNSGGGGGGSGAAGGQQQQGQQPPRRQTSWDERPGDRPGQQQSQQYNSQHWRNNSNSYNSHNKHQNNRQYHDNRSRSNNRDSRPYHHGHHQQYNNGRGGHHRGGHMGHRGNMRFPGPGRPYSPHYQHSRYSRSPSPRGPRSPPEPPSRSSSSGSSRSSSGIRRPAQQPPPPQQQLPQEPVLGSEEERQQKIAETASKLKQSLSSITDEERSSFWEKDLNAAVAGKPKLPHADDEQTPNSNKLHQDEDSRDAPTTVKTGKPELRHEPPELRLTHDDFKDIGRVDAVTSNAAADTADSASNKRIDYDDLCLAPRDSFDDDGLVERAQDESDQILVDSVSVSTVNYDDDGRVSKSKTVNEGTVEDTESETQATTAKTSETLICSPLPEPLDFENVMKILEADQSDSLDYTDINKVSCDPGKKSKRNIEDSEMSAGPLTSTVREVPFFEESLSNTTIAMCPPPSTQPLEFAASNSKPSLGFAPRLPVPDFSFPPASTILNTKETSKHEKQKTTSQILQPPPAFDPRKPLSLNETEEFHQLPPAFDPRLSITERSSLFLNNKAQIAPVMLPPFGAMPAAPMPITQPAPQFLPPVQMNYPSVMPVSAPLPVPPIPNPVSVVAPRFIPPAPAELALQPPSVNFEDGLEEMQEAMEFAQQLMSMSGEKSTAKSESMPITSEKITELEEPMAPPIDLLKMTQLIDEQKSVTEKAVINLVSSAKVTVPITEINTIAPQVIIPVIPVISNVEQESNPEKRPPSPPPPPPPPPQKKPTTETYDEELLWKNRVISRFLTMSKNEIRNMLNNSSLRKFNLAMSHLVKEKKCSLSQESRINEDERMKEYNREEFMTQLNAMLDPNATVDISNLPTAFIHHLNEVLQLDPLQFAENEKHSTLQQAIIQPSVIQQAVIQPTVINSQEITAIKAYVNNEPVFVHSSHYSDQIPISTVAPQKVRPKKEKAKVKVIIKRDKAIQPPEPVNKIVVRNDLIASKKTAMNIAKKEPVITKKVAPVLRQPLVKKAPVKKASVAPNTTKTTVASRAKQQQLLEAEQRRNQLIASEFVMKDHSKSSTMATPVVNMADIDDIFSAGIAKVRGANKPSSPSRPSNVPSGPIDKIDKNAKDGSERPAFNLDDIFSAGIAKAKSSLKNMAPHDYRKIQGYKRTADVEEIERWMRKEREHIDAYRNLTKEEWDAKYGKTIDRVAFERELESTFSALRYEEEERRHEEANRDLSNSDTETTTTTSSSDSEEETPPDVQQLLRVIKEREKIAKKKSINETIRDEVAAEIERKWREKNKYKERKIKKRAKKRLKKDKRKRIKDKRKHKKRLRDDDDEDDESEDSESDDNTAPKILTEDEIKKEIKEEPEFSKVTPTSSIKATINQGKLKVISTVQNRPTDVVTRKVTFSDKVVHHQLGDGKTIVKKSSVLPASIIVDRNSDTKRIISRVLPTAHRSIIAEAKLKDPRLTPQKGEQKIVQAKKEKEAAADQKLVNCIQKEKEVVKKVKAKEPTPAVKEPEKSIVKPKDEISNNQKQAADNPKEEKESLLNQMTEDVPCTPEVESAESKEIVIPQKPKEPLTPRKMLILEKPTETDVLKSIELECKRNLEEKLNMSTDIHRDLESENSKKPSLTSPVKLSNTSSVDQSSSDPRQINKNPKKLDINAYKARLLERQKKEQETKSKVASSPKEPGLSKIKKKQVSMEGKGPIDTVETTPKMKRKLRVISNIQIKSADVRIIKNLQNDRIHVQSTKPEETQETSETIPSIENVPKKQNSIESNQPNETEKTQNIPSNSDEVNVAINEIDEVSKSCIETEIVSEPIPEDICSENISVDPLLVSDGLTKTTEEETNKYSNVTDSMEVLDHIIQDKSTTEITEDVPKELAEKNTLGDGEKDVLPVNENLLQIVEYVPVVAPIADTTDFVNTQKIIQEPIISEDFTHSRASQLKTEHAAQVIEELVQDFGMQMDPSSEVNEIEITPEEGSRLIENQEQSPNLLTQSNDIDELSIDAPVTINEVIIDEQASSEKDELDNIVMEPITDPLALDKKDEDELLELNDEELEKDLDSHEQTTVDYNEEVKISSQDQSNTGVLIIDEFGIKETTQEELQKCVNEKFESKEIDEEKIFETKELNIEKETPAEQVDNEKGSAEIIPESNNDELNEQHESQFSETTVSEVKDVEEVSTDHENFEEKHKFVADNIDDNAVENILSSTNMTDYEIIQNPITTASPDEEFSKTPQEEKQDLEEEKVTDKSEKNCEKLDSEETISCDILPEKTNTSEQPCDNQELNDDEIDDLTEVYTNKLLLIRATLEAKVNENKKREEENSLMHDIKQIEESCEDIISVASETVENEDKEIEDQEHQEPQEEVCTDAIHHEEILSDVQEIETDEELEEGEIIDNEEIDEKDQEQIGEEIESTPLVAAKIECDVVDPVDILLEKEAVELETELIEPPVIIAPVNLSDPIEKTLLLLDAPEIIQVSEIVEEDANSVALDAFNNTAKLEEALLTSPQTPRILPTVVSEKTLSTPIAIIHVGADGKKKFNRIDVPTSLVSNSTVPSVSCPAKPTVPATLPAVIINDSLSAAAGGKLLKEEDTDREQKCADQSEMKKDITRNDNMGKIEPPVTENKLEVTIPMGVNKVESHIIGDFSEEIRVGIAEVNENKTMSSACTLQSHDDTKKVNDFESTGPITENDGLEIKKEITDSKINNYRRTRRKSVENKTSKSRNNKRTSESSSNKLHKVQKKKHKRSHHRHKTHVTSALRMEDLINIDLVKLDTKEKIVQRIIDIEAIIKHCNDEKNKLFFMLASDNLKSTDDKTGSSSTSLPQKAGLSEINRLLESKSSKDNLYPALINKSLESKTKNKEVPVPKLDVIRESSDDEEIRNINRTPHTSGSHSRKYEKGYKHKYPSTSKESSVDIDDGSLHKVNQEHEITKRPMSRAKVSVTSSRQRKSSMSSDAASIKLSSMVKSTHKPKEDESSDADSLFDKELKNEKGNLLEFKNKKSHSSERSNGKKTKIKKKILSSDEDELPQSSDNESESGKLNRIRKKTKKKSTSSSSSNNDILKKSNNKIESSEESGNEHVSKTTTHCIVKNKRVGSDYEDKPLINLMKEKIQVKNKRASKVKKSNFKKQKLQEPKMSMLENKAKTSDSDTSAGALRNTQQKIQSPVCKVKKTHEARKQEKMNSSDSEMEQEKKSDHGKASKYDKIDANLLLEKKTALENDSDVSGSIKESSQSHQSPGLEIKKQNKVELTEKSVDDANPVTSKSKSQRKIEKNPPKSGRSSSQKIRNLDDGQDKISKKKNKGEKEDIKDEVDINSQKNQTKTYNKTTQESVGIKKMVSKKTETKISNETVKVKRIQSKTPVNMIRDTKQKKSRPIIDSGTSDDEISLRNKSQKSKTSSPLPINSDKNDVEKIEIHKKSEKVQSKSPENSISSRPKQRLQRIVDSDYSDEEYSNKKIIRTDFLSRETSLQPGSDNLEKNIERPSSKIKTNKIRVIDSDSSHDEDLPIDKGKRNSSESRPPSIAGNTIHSEKNNASEELENIDGSIEKDNQVINIKEKNEVEDNKKQNSKISITQHKEIQIETEKGSKGLIVQESLESNNLEKSDIGSVVEDLELKASSRDDYVQNASIKKGHESNNKQTSNRVDEVKSLSKVTIYSDDSNLDSNEIIRSSGKGLKMLEESLKMEVARDKKSDNKKNKKNLKHILNPISRKALSSDEEVISTDFMNRKNKVKSDTPITQEMSKHYDDSIDSVVKSIVVNKGAIKNKSINILSDNKSAKALNKKLLGIKDLKVKVEKLKLCQVEKYKRKILNKSDDNLSSDKLPSIDRKLEVDQLKEVINLNDSTSKVQLEESGIQVKPNEENTKLPNEAEISDEEVNVDEVEAKESFMYAGSPYVVLDNTEDQDLPIEEESIKEHNVPFTYEGMPIIRNRDYSSPESSINSPQLATNTSGPRNIEKFNMHKDVIDISNSIEESPKICETILENTEKIQECETIDTLQNPEINKFNVPEDDPTQKKENKEEIILEKHVDITDEKLSEKPIESPIEDNKIEVIDLETDNILMDENNQKDDDIEIIDTVKVTEPEEETAIIIEKKLVPVLDKIPTFHTNKESSNKREEPVTCQSPDESEHIDVENIESNSPNFIDKSESPSEELASIDKSSCTSLQNQEDRFSQDLESKLDKKSSMNKEDSKTLGNNDSIINFEGGENILDKENSENSGPLSNKHAEKAETSTKNNDEQFQVFKEGESYINQSVLTESGGREEQLGKHNLKDNSIGSAVGVHTACIVNNDSIDISEKVVSNYKNNSTEVVEVSVTGMRKNKNKNQKEGHIATVDVPKTIVNEKMPSVDFVKESKVDKVTAISEPEIKEKKNRGRKRKNTQEKTNPVRRSSRHTEENADDNMSIKSGRSSVDRDFNKPRNEKYLVDEGNESDSSTSKRPRARSGSRSFRDDVSTKSNRSSVDRDFTKSKSKRQPLEPIEEESGLNKKPGRRPKQSGHKILTTESGSLKLLKGKRKRKNSSTISEMVPCKVRLVDCKYDYLIADAQSELFKAAGITSIRNYPPSSGSIDLLDKKTKKKSKTTNQIKISDQIPEKVSENSVLEPKVASAEEDELAMTLESKNEMLESGKETLVANVSVDQKVNQKLNSETHESSNEVDPKQKAVDGLVESTEEESIPPSLASCTDESDAIKSPKTSTIELNKETIVNQKPDLLNLSAEEKLKLSAEEQLEEVDISENPKESDESSHEKLERKNSSIARQVEDNEQPKIEYFGHKGPILFIKIHNDSFLAACEDGSVYQYDLNSNKLLQVFKGHTSSVTCLCIYKVSDVQEPKKKELLYTGSLDQSLRCFNMRAGLEIHVNDAGSAIQCMDQAWGAIFLGTKSGTISRFNIKSGIMHDLVSTDKSVLALKATSEGARRVLIVASRQQKLIVRDAFTGLQLRTISGQKTFTIYTLLRDHNLVYCGTSSTSIAVYDFVTGEQKTQYDSAGTGVVCLCLYKKLLFAGCYDGQIYIFNTTDNKLICKIPGPGNMVLSMEILDNKIIAGSKDKSLHIWNIPEQVVEILDGLE